MAQQNIRWQQRFANYSRAFAKLQEVIDTLGDNWDKNNISDSTFVLSDLEIEGTIQRFEYTHELAWNLMKDYLKYQGNTEIGGSRDATREAFKIDLIKDAQTWMDMIKSRNQTSPTYEQDNTLEEFFITIVYDYYPLFKDFEKKMEELKDKGQNDIFSEEL